MTLPTRLYAITGFDSGPHWDTAIIRADSPEQAKQILAGHLAESRETVWEPGIDPSYVADWTVHPVPDDEAVVFCLGAGCRS